MPLFVVPIVIRVLIVVGFLLCKNLLSFLFLPGFHQRERARL